MRVQTKRICLSGVCLSLCLLLPILTLQSRQLGNMLCLMHIPVFICGMLCGGGYGALVGACAPLLRFLCFGMPVLFPTGIAMAFELAAYGFFSGFLRSRLRKTNVNLYLSLILSMLAGRVVWGVVRFIQRGFFGVDFSFSVFLTAGFATALPGIALHILLVPITVMALEKVGIADDA